MANVHFTYMTSSSSFVRKVIEVPNFPARPVRPKKKKEDQYGASLFMRRISVVHTYAVDISLYGIRHLEVDHKANILDINATASQVGRNQNIRFSIAQRL